MFATQVTASERVSSSLVCSLASWLFICSCIRLCWSSSVATAFLCCSACSCASFSLWQSCSRRWNWLSKWSTTSCACLNCDTKTNHSEDASFSTYIILQGKSKLSQGCQIILVHRYFYFSKFINWLGLNTVESWFWPSGHMFDTWGLNLLWTKQESSTMSLTALHASLTLHPHLYLGHFHHLLNRDLVHSKSQEMMVQLLFPGLQFGLLFFEYLYLLFLLKHLSPLLLCLLHSFSSIFILNEKQGWLLLNVVNYTAASLSTFQCYTFKNMSKLECNCRAPAWSLCSSLTFLCKFSSFFIINT